MKKLILLSALTLAAGCGGVKPPIEARSDPYRTPQVEYVDESLRDNTAVGEIKLTRDSADILFVTVPIRMTTNSTKSIDWRIAFLDGNGRPMSETGWSQKYLNANTFEYITANSLSPGARDFRVDLRYSK